MAVLWFGAVVFLVLLFVLFVPLANGGGNNLGYANSNMAESRQPPVEIHYPPQPPTQSSSRTGCLGILALLLIVALFFVGAVLFWSASVQAGSF